MEIGSPVFYTDEYGKEHNALVTAVWGMNAPTKSLNIVYVSDDETKTDQYGRQIQRETSVVHQHSQPAHGRFWRGLDEDHK